MRHWAGLGCASAGRTCDEEGRRRPVRADTMRSACPQSCRDGRDPDGAGSLGPGEVVVAGPLLETKLHVPRRRRGLVARPRLSERLSRGGTAAGPRVRARRVREDHPADGVAGGGPDDGTLVAWLSLDPRDDDPTTFWTYLVSAAADGPPGGRCGRARPPAVAAARRRTRCWPPCSTSCRPSRTMSCWSSTTTTSSTRGTSTTAWPSSWSTSRRRSTWSSPPAPTRRCRWPGCGHAASWSRSAPPTCASRRTRRRPT